LKGQIISRYQYCINWCKVYSRTEADFNPGSFRIKGDTVDVYPSYADEAYRIHFFGDEIEEIESFDTKNSQVPENLKDLLFIPLICL
jgi:excinuclease ABC subunit B